MSTAVAAMLLVGEVVLVDQRAHLLPHTVVWNPLSIACLMSCSA